MLLAPETDARWAETWVSLLLRWKRHALLVREVMMNGTHGCVEGRSPYRCEATFGCVAKLPSIAKRFLQNTQLVVAMLRGQHGALGVSQRVVGGAHGDPAGSIGR